MFKLLGIVAAIFLVLWIANYVTWSLPKLNEKGKALWAKIKSWFGFAE